MKVREMTYVVLMTCALISLGLSLPGIASAQTTLRVDGTNGTNTAGCGTEATPCSTIQWAVDSASIDDIILVSEGTYVDNPSHSCSNMNPSEPAVVCVYDTRLTIKGGFPSGNWTTASPATPTIIDGNNTIRGVMVQGGSGETILQMEDVTIQNGYDMGDSSGSETYTNSFGGGMNALGATLDLRRVTFLNNKAIGGSGNESAGGAGAGGGLVIRNAPSSCNLEDLVFTGNSAAGGSGTVRGGYGHGGGLFTYGSVITGDNLTFTGNTATGGSTAGLGSVSGYIRGDGQGGGADFHTGADVTISNLTATQNTATGGNAATDAGGAFGGGVYGEGATVVLTDVDLRNNEAHGGDAANGGLGAGGGMMAINSDFTIDRGYLISNIVKGGDGSAGTTGAAGGGAGYFTSSGIASVLDITNGILANNSVAPGDSGTAVGGGGGALFLQATTVTIAHSTIAQNEIDASMLGQAMVLLALGTSTTVTMSNSIVADHTVPANKKALYAQASNTVTFNQGLFACNITDTGGDGTFNGTGTMTSACPADFVSPGSPDYDYHIQETSPAAGAATGSNEALDIDGETRDDGAPDLGADEYKLVIPPFFSDDFESGDTTAWSQVVP